MINENRKQVTRTRKIIVWYNNPHAHICTKKELIAALHEVKDAENIVLMAEEIGFRPAGFGSMDGEDVYYCNMYLTVERNEPETDEEYYQRIKEETERQKQKEQQERDLYIRLKAKYEDEQ